MKKYLAWVETEQNYETWLLIDSSTQKRAETIAESVEGFIELRACKEVVANEDIEGISHKFTILE